MICVVRVRWCLLSFFNVWQKQQKDLLVEREQVQRFYFSVQVVLKDIKTNNLFSEGPPWETLLVCLHPLNFLLNPSTDLDWFNWLLKTVKITSQESCNFRASRDTFSGLNFISVIPTCPSKTFTIPNVQVIDVGSELTISGVAFWGDHIVPLSYPMSLGDLPQIIPDWNGSLWCKHRQGIPDFLDLGVLGHQEWHHFKQQSVKTSSLTFWRNKKRQKCHQTVTAAMGQSAETVSVAFGRASVFPENKKFRRWFVTEEFRSQSQPFSCGRSCLKYFCATKVSEIGKDIRGRHSQPSFLSQMCLVLIDINQRCKLVIAWVALKEGI